MPYHLDPEGHDGVLLPTSAQTLIIPAERRVLLYGAFDSAWEQAIVIYLNDAIYPEQLGSFLRPLHLIIPAQGGDYELTLVGWHKRSAPNENLPWMASSGQRQGPVVLAWDDSAADSDYRDVRIKLLLD